MTPHDLMLPPGTSLMISRSQLILTLDWTGHAGRHLVRLHQTLASDEGVDRDEGIARAVGLFRNVVSLEVIDDAMNAGEWAPHGSDEDSGDLPEDRHPANEF